VAEGQPRDALASYQESLTYYQQLDNRLGIAESLERVAHVLEGFGQLEEAARLLGAADQLRDVLGAPRSPEAQVAHVRTVKAIRAVLGAQPFDEAWAAGAALPLGDAIPVALAVRV
jgi:hypothetical protein